MPIVCAIILDYFGSSKTIACLTSLIDQGLDTVMIVDNSGDRQANMLLQDALGELSQRKVPFTIHQIVNPQNLGYAAGVNNALRWLEENHPHHYYLLINNDAEGTPGMLPELLKFMREHDKTVLTAPVVDIGDQQLSGYWYHRFSGLMFSHHVIGTFQYLTGCCLLVDRRIIGDALFDEDFFMYGEDAELSWRLRLAGWDTACISQAIVRHEGVGSSHQGGFFYEYHLVRGHILLARKLARCQWEMPFLFFGRLLTLSARAIVRAIRFRSLVPITACINALRKHNVSFTG
ncbi:MAG: glycosyltransferase [Deltaproteobacteria bacterium]